MLPVAFLFAAATPVQAIAHSLADYSECLRVSAGRPDRQAAAERAQLAIARCHLQRETTIRQVTELLLPRVDATSARARVEQILADMERLYPAILAVGGGVEIPLPIAPQVRRYTDCLTEQMEIRGAMRPGSVTAYGAAVDASIAACTATRNAALAEAEALLSTNPEFGEASRRHAVINRAFDQTDEVQRSLPRMMDAISHEQGNDASNR